MTPVFSIFKIKRQERILALLALAVFVFLNALLIYKYYGLFTRGGNLGFWSVFWNHFRVSGFDSYTYIILSKWEAYYVVYRHPLLAFMMYPFYLLNHWLLIRMEYNYAVFIVAAILVFSAVYSFLFMYRILHEVLKLKRFDATLLTVMFFSFAYIMLTTMVPDHFCLSMFLLTMTLYIAGTKMNNGRRMKTWQSFILFFFTAGITLSNGLKIWLAQWFANGRDFFHLRNLLMGVAVPAALLWGVSIYENAVFVKPLQERGQKILKEREKKDTVFAKKVNARNEAFKSKTGETISDKGFMKWTDVSTPRMQSLSDNIFGESLQLHDKYLLRDIHYGRPVFVKYSHWYNYVAEAVVVLLFVIGVLLGCRNRFMLLCLSWLAIDAGIHFVLGFGLNEVYIMTAHWAFVIPVAMAFVVKRLSGRWLLALRILLVCLAVFLFVYNFSLVFEYMSKPLIK
ncbi:MAG: hypothetical protein IJ562_10150 [Prevotella sp.]|nr:hypothetical protein [Prevotella sp.]